MMSVWWKTGGAVLALLVAGSAPALAQDPSEAASEIRLALDDLTDRRFKIGTRGLEKIVRQIEREGLGFEDVEALLRTSRVSYPDRDVPVGEQISGQPLACDHVDYETTFELYLPESYDPAEAWPLIVVGHGGNGEMSQERAERTAKSYLSTWVEAAEAKGFIAAAPATARGWGRIGNSVLLSLISHLTRRFHIDPDRIYATGHSMGGHMSWRCGIGLADRWGAVGPMSGGYDYVENEQVYRLFNVPGYAVHGSKEPYQIADFNRKIKKWMGEHGYPWVVVEKPGGHEIFPDEVLKTADYFLAHPRNLYRDQVYVHVGADPRVEEAEKKRPRWDRSHTWKKGRPIDHGIFHWVRTFPVKGKKNVDRRAFVERTSDSKVTITARGFQKLRLYLHPRMFDLEKPLEVTANGRTKTYRPKVDVESTLDLVREFDDRGRCFAAFVDVSIRGKEEVGAPRVRPVDEDDGR